MPFEQVEPRVIGKPWGSQDIRPWRNVRNRTTVGELAFDRPQAATPASALLFKLLFTKKKLSIQVHPNNDCARLMGEPNGKTEAWYVLFAEAGAQVAVGLDRPMTKAELRSTIADGSIADLVKWQSAVAGDMFFVPAGTIHAIGAGLVIAEIQQRSDTTFRLFDHGRKRKLQVDRAIDVANLEITKAEPAPIYLTVERMKLVSCPYFVFERVDLPAGSNWELRADHETWALVIGGAATIGDKSAGIGDAFFVESDRISITTSGKGVAMLLAYATGAPDPDLLRDLVDEGLAHASTGRGMATVLPFASREGRA